jgi:hypothetical protein
LRDLEAQKPKNQERVRLAERSKRGPPLREPTTSQERSYRAKASARFGRDDSFVMG